jgi:hypothetical protein
MDSKPVKGYVTFMTINRPWYEEFTLWRDRECSPRFVVPLLSQAFEGLQKSDFLEGLGRSGHAASMMASLDPTHLIFHSRTILDPESDKPASAVPESLLQPHYKSEHPLSAAAIFVYRVWLLNPVVPSGSKSPRPWEVEILQTTEKFEKDQKVESMKVVHERQMLPTLLERINRLANYAKVGGEPEEVY